MNLRVEGRVVCAGDARRRRVAARKARYAAYSLFRIRSLVELRRRRSRTKWTRRCRCRGVPAVAALPCREVDTHEPLPALFVVESSFAWNGAALGFERCEPAVAANKISKMLVCCVDERAALDAIQAPTTSRRVARRSSCSSPRSDARRGHPRRNPVTRRATRPDYTLARSPSSPSRSFAQADRRVHAPSAAK